MNREPQQKLNLHNKLIKNRIDIPEDVSEINTSTFITSGPKLRHIKLRLISIYSVIMNNQD